MVLPLDVRRRAVAEALGTALLLAAIVGSGVMADRLAGGNVALALLANTLATAATLVALILVLGPVSGAHFNPAVTWFLYLRGDVPCEVAWRYILAQVAGAFLGVALAHVMFEVPIYTWSGQVRTGVGLIVGEAVATFGLLLIVGLVIVTRSRHGAIAVGAFIAGAYWFTSSTSFANPAVTLARAATDTFAGIRPADVPVFLLGQAFGLGAAVATLRWLVVPSSEMS